jgi:penicillin-binding protein 2
VDSFRSSKLSYADRRKVILVIFVIVAVIYIVRLFQIQVIDESYKISAANSSLRNLTVYPARGLIYDRNGKLMVYNEVIYDLMVTPNQVRVLDTAAICTLLEMQPSDVKERIEKARVWSPYRPSVFEKQISKAEFARIQEQLFKFPGFYVQARTQRYYPYQIAPHTFGYIGEVNQSDLDRDGYYRPGDYIGISGIERAYEKELRGQKGMRKVWVDKFNNEIGRVAEGKYDTSAVAGLDLYTTIDLDLQRYGEELLQNKSGSIVAIEPATGEILALVSHPGYDPNLLVGRVRTKNYGMLQQDPNKPLYNRALQARYPPGSTFKMVNALIGQQLGVLTAQTTYPCAMGFHFGGLTVGCHAHPSPLDLSQSIQHSCNAYYCRAFRAIIDANGSKPAREGFEEWRRQVLSFGFGQALESDIPNQSSGNIPTAAYYDRYHGKNRWKSITIISLSIGQGEITATPLQLANFAATIANRGFYVVPHVGKALGRKDSLLQKYTIHHNTSVNRSYYDLVVDAMENVVIAGTGRVARIDSISVCGKTGTAQNPHGEDHSIFIAFAPKDNPKIAIAVVVENAGFGATWAAPIASLMIEKYLRREITAPNRLDLEKRMKEVRLSP